VREHGGDARTPASGQEVQPTSSNRTHEPLPSTTSRDFVSAVATPLRDPKFKTADGELERLGHGDREPPRPQPMGGIESWAHDPYGRSRYGCRWRRKETLAFVEHMVAAMRSDSGRVAVVVPQGVLFRGGAGEAEIRQRMLEAGLFDAVVGPPSNPLQHGLARFALVLRAKPHPIVRTRCSSSTHPSGSSSAELNETWRTTTWTPMPREGPRWREGSSRVFLLSHRGTSTPARRHDIGRYVREDAVGYARSSPLPPILETRRRVTQAEEALRTCDFEREAGLLE